MSGEPQELPAATAKWRKTIDVKLDALQKDIDSIRSQVELDRANARSAARNFETLFAEIRKEIKYLLKRVVKAEREATVAMDRTAQEPIQLMRKE